MLAGKSSVADGGNSSSGACQISLSEMRGKTWKSKAALPPDAGARDQYTIGHDVARDAAGRIWVAVHRVARGHRPCVVGDGHLDCSLLQPECNRLTQHAVGLARQDDLIHAHARQIAAEARVIRAPGKDLLGHCAGRIPGARTHGAETTSLMKDSRLPGLYPGARP